MKKNWERFDKVFGDRCIYRKWAKTECRKYDETFLHVFSAQMDYAKTQASTPYEILGVKVWVSYI